MVYTKTRLEHAIKIFRQGAPYRRKRGLKDTYLDRHLNRELRKSTKSSRAKAFHNWNFSGGANESDEDEYDPNEDRRRLKARRKKKEGSGKKKTSASGDEEKLAKRMKKGANPTYRVSDNGYVVLRLTNPKSRTRLEELSQDRKTNPEYFGRDTAASRGRFSDDGEGTSNVMQDVSDDNDIRGRIFDEYLTRTSLRSGRVLQRHVESKFSDNTVQFNQATSSETTENKDRRQDSPSRSARSIVNRSINQIGNSSAAPIEIDSSGDEQSESRPQSKTHRNRPFSGRLDREHRSVPTRASPLTSFGSGIETFETSFAHPINFKLIPVKNEAPECDFCKDWTMAVVGHGIRHITATRNPQNLTEYHEIAGGHRSEGKDPTQMCVKCSLDRLLVMRCHSPLCQPERSLPANTFANPFSRIHYRDLNRQQAFTYLRYLFCRMNGEPHRVRSAYEFPACNLCPQPASWRCYKWQERDHAMRPCRIPKFDRNTQTSANSSVMDLSSSTNPSPNESPIARAASQSVSSTEPRPRATEPVVISLLDSSDDEEAAPSPESDPSLRHPLRGCGLHLCNTCHAFIMQSCGGLLPERQILGYLDSTKFGRRADVQWLFKGSLLEKSFEAGRK